MDYITEALKNYNMPTAKTSLIRHNENMTISVEDKFLLRIHKHVEGFSTNYIYDNLDRTATYLEELSFLSYLREQGMQVQIPVKNSQEEYVTVLSDGTLATMLRWLPGRTMGKDDISVEVCYQIGEMVGKLHQIGKSYVPKVKLDYDAKLCNRLKEKICGEEKDSIQNRNPLLKSEFFEVMGKACDVIAEQLKKMESEFFLVHSDLSLSNMLFTEEGIIPIDFSLMGFGHPMMDIGALYCNINGPDNRKAIADGYKAAGGSIDLKVLDSCFALNILLSIGLHLESWGVQDWFPDRLERWCRETFGPLGEGEPIFSPDYYLLNVK